jgi:hypothetical protein
MRDMEKTPESLAENTQKERRDGRGRSPGSRRTQFGAEGVVPPKRLVALSEECEGMLAVMEHVLSKPPSGDTTYQQKQYRKWLRDSRATFMARRAELEKAALATKEPAKRSFGAPTIVQRDEGAERVGGLIEVLLSGIHAEQAAEDAKIAARPDAAQIAATLQNSLKAALEREKMWKRQAESLRERVKQLECSGPAKPTALPDSRETQE